MIRIYTDGSAITKRGSPGGWGIYITDGKDLHKGYKGGTKGTTISRMEMQAILEALRYCNNNLVKVVDIYSDSQMVVNSINKGWLKSWERERYLHRVNSDIWKLISKELKDIKMNKIKLVIRHIKGHQENLSCPHIFGNNVADGLADYKNYL